MIIRKKTFRCLELCLILCFLSLWLPPSFSIPCLTLCIGGIGGIGGYMLFPTRAFLQRWLVGTAVYASVLLLPMLTARTQAFPIELSLITLAFSMLLSSLVLCLLQLLASCGRNLLLCLVRFTAAVLFFFPPLLFWAYGLHTHALLSADTVLVILQTYPVEALQYLKDTLTPLHSGLLVVLLYLLCTTASWFSRNCADTCPPPKRRYTALYLLLVCVLLPRTSNNLYVTVVNDTSEALKTQETFLQAAPTRQARLKELSQETRPGLFVLVIGESENRLHMSAYGYERDTTPWLRAKAADDDCLLFTNAYANYVSTAQALSYALTEKNQYMDLPLQDAATLPETARAAGIRTIMRSNQGKFGLYSTAVTAIEDECDDALWLHPQQFSNRGQERLNFRVEDGDIVKELKSIPIASTDRTLLILHLNGSHNPYPCRYPEDFHPFGTATITDQYDNTVAYNDKIMNQIYESVRWFPNFQCLIYLSDHSEGIDHGIMHDSNSYLPEMTYIPFYILASPAFRSAHRDQWATLASHRSAYFTNDLLYDLMCSLMGIQTGHMLPENNIARPEYDARPERFRTEHGKLAITPPAVAEPQGGQASFALAP